MLMIRPRGPFLTLLNRYYDGINFFVIGGFAIVGYLMMGVSELKKITVIFLVIGILVTLWGGYMWLFQSSEAEGLETLGIAAMGFGVTCLGVICVIISAVILHRLEK